MGYKTILKEAHRYKAVINILNTIINESAVSYPVKPFIHYDTCGESYTKWRVDGSDVRKEAELCKQAIEQDDYGCNNPCINLLVYVESKYNMMLHNYANSISHRHFPVIEMDNIRNWLCLGCVIEHFSDDMDLVIPTGWKRNTYNKEIKNG